MDAYDTRVHLLQLLRVILYGKEYEQWLKQIVLRKTIYWPKVLFKAPLFDLHSIFLLSVSFSFSLDYLLNDPLCLGKAEPNAGKYMIIG